MSGSYRLNRLLTLEGTVRTPNGTGGFVEDWAVLGAMWAHMRAGIGRERGADVATVSRVPYRIIVRAAPIGAASRPVAGQRFRDDGRVFRIEAVADCQDAPLYIECFTVEEALT